MFERNRVDNASNSSHQTAIPAELTLTDGEVLSGHFLISAARALTDVLNGESHFLEFEPFKQPKRFVSKHAIRAVKLIDAVPASNLDNRRALAGEFDPYAALGVRSDAEWDDVRHAYLRLARTYHPDRFLSVELPIEVRDYLSQMSRRINAAYSAIEAPRLVVKKADMRPDPVYTSRPRA
jgi:DnaJ domain